MRVIVYRIPKNAFIPSAVFKPSVLIWLWRLSKVKLHETEMVQVYMQSIIFFCAEQLSSNHKQWVRVMHYRRRRISLQMPFALGRVQSGGQIGIFVLKVLWTLKGRLFNWLKNIFIWSLLKFTKFAFVYHSDWCHISASILGVCRMSVIWNLVYLLYLPRVSLSSIEEHRD